MGLRFFQRFDSAEIQCRILFLVLLVLVKHSACEDGAACRYLYQHVGGNVGKGLSGIGLLDASLSSW